MPSPIPSSQAYERQPYVTALCRVDVQSLWVGLNDNTRHRLSYADALCMDLRLGDTVRLDQGRIVGVALERRHYSVIPLSSVWVPPTPAPISGTEPADAPAPPFVYTFTRPLLRRLIRKPPKNHRECNI